MEYLYWNGKAHNRLAISPENELCKKKEDFTEYTATITMLTNHLL